MHDTLSLKSSSFETDKREQTSQNCNAMHTFPALFMLIFKCHQNANMALYLLLNLT